jgi:hypothetical protein
MRATKPRKRGSAKPALPGPMCHPLLEMPTPPQALPTAEPTDLSHRAARERKALWVAAALIVVWGSNFSVQKMVFAAMSPGGFLMVRYLVMPVAAALLLCWRHGLHWPRVPKSDLLALLKLGIAGHLLHVGLVTYGIHWSTAFSSSLICSWLCWIRRRAASAVWP